MSMFDNLKGEKKEESLESLKQGLSEHQLKVARTNYRNALIEMSKYMDIGNQELKQRVAIEVIKRIKTFELVEAL